MKIKHLLYPKGPTKETWIRWIIIRLAWLLVLFATLAIGGGFIFKNDLIFTPHTIQVSTPARYKTPYENISLQISDGVTLKAWYVPSPDKNNTITAIIFQGNGGNKSIMIDRLVACRVLGINAFIVDYPGYGDSEGVPSEKGTYQAAEAAWQWVAANKSKPEDIVIYGFSLGGGVASWLAEQHPPRALILDSTFTKLKDVPKHAWPRYKLYFDLVLNNDYNTEERLKKIKSPVLFLHNDDDKIVPSDFSRQMFDHYQGGPKELAIGHGNHMDFMNNFVHNVNGYKSKMAKIIGVEEKKPSRPTDNDDKQQEQ